MRFRTLVTIGRNEALIVFKFIVRRMTRDRNCSRSVWNAVYLDSIDEIATRVLWNFNATHLVYGSLMKFAL